MPKGRTIFDYEKCKGCSVCVAYCPQHILTQDKTIFNRAGYNIISVTEPEKCTGCAFCAMMCPDSVITVEVEK